MKPLLLVLGATGEVGRAVVAAALAQGRAVVAVARQLAGLRQLRAAHPDADLITVRGTVADDAGSSRLLRTLRQLRRPFSGIAVALCGECVKERLLDAPLSTLRRVLETNLLAHASAARHLLPLLADGRGSYVLVSGPGGEQPWAGHGPRSLVAASLRMLARVLHEEARALAVRVQLLSVESPLCTDDNRDHACPQWPTPAAVGSRVLALLDGDSSRPAPAIVRFENNHNTRPEFPTRGPLPALQQVRTLLNTLSAVPQIQESSP